MLNAEEAAREALAHNPIPKPRKKKKKDDSEEPEGNEDDEDGESGVQDKDIVQGGEPGEYEEEEQDAPGESETEDPRSGHQKGMGGKQVATSSRSNSTATRSKGKQPAFDRHVTWEPGYKLTVELPKPSTPLSRTYPLASHSSNQSGVEGNVTVNQIIPWSTRR